MSNFFNSFNSSSVFKKGNCESQIAYKTDKYYWLQTVVDQLWSKDLVFLCQKELNRFYAKERNNRWFKYENKKFYLFKLNKNQPPKFSGKLEELGSSGRDDEIVLNFRATIFGTVVLKLDNEDNQSFTSLLVKKYGWKRKNLQLNNDKKKCFLIKELNLNGRSRFVLRSLVKTFPYFTSFTFTFLEMPVMQSNHYHDFIEISEVSNFYSFLQEKFCMLCASPNKLIVMMVKQIQPTKEFKMMKSNDKRTINWNKMNVLKNLDLNSQTFYPVPNCIVRINVIELENIELSPSQPSTANDDSDVLFLRVQVGNKMMIRAVLASTANTISSPVINLVSLFPCHDYFEECKIDLFKIHSSKFKEMQKFHQIEPSIKPINHIRFQISNLNGQDFWVPLNGLVMIHLSCACFKLTATLKTIKKAIRLARNLEMTKNKLSSLHLPIACVFVYVESFHQYSSIKAHLNLFTNLQLSLYLLNQKQQTQKQTIESLKSTKTKLIFRNSFNFFLYDNPFHFKICVELLSASSKRFISSKINLSDFKEKSNLVFDEFLPIYAIDSKDFRKLNDFDSIDKEECGLLVLRICIRYVHFDNQTIEKLLLAPVLRGHFDRDLLVALVTEQTSRRRGSNIIEKEVKKLKRRDYLNDECLAKLYFKLNFGNVLEIGVLDIENVLFFDKIEVELWKGNFKISSKTVKKNEPFQFNIESNLQQYAIRFIISQKSTSLFKNNFKAIADRFLSLPILTPDFNFQIKSYILRKKTK